MIVNNTDVGVVDCLYFTGVTVYMGFPLDTIIAVSFCQFATVPVVSHVNTVSSPQLPADGTCRVGRPSIICL